MPQLFPATVNSSRSTPELLLTSRPGDPGTADPVEIVRPRSVALVTPLIVVRDVRSAPAPPITVMPDRVHEAPAYEPSATWIVAPLADASSACWSVAHGSVNVPGLVSLPCGAM